MKNSHSSALGALCDVPFSSIDWKWYEDAQSTLAPDETHKLNLLSLPMMGQEFVASHREQTTVEKAVPIAELLGHLGVHNYEIITSRGTVTLSELRIRKTLYIMSMDARWDICIDDPDDKSKALWEEISRISFGNGDKPYVLLFGEKPVQTSPVISSLIQSIRKFTGAHLIFPL